VLLAAAWLALGCGVALGSSLEVGGVTAEGAAVAKTEYEPSSSQAAEVYLYFGSEAKAESVCGVVFNGGSEVGAFYSVARAPT
jgi:hypothetical protein